MSDIYKLTLLSYVYQDGCLGPLDAHMASQIFEEGVLNFLLRQKRTVIMVTNHVHYVSYANQVNYVIGENNKYHLVMC